jgi:hypothetical protein
MDGLEFALFLPLLMAGVALKSFALRNSFLQSALLFAMALPLSPLALLLAVISFPKHSEHRKQILSKRATPRFWLLKTILSGDRR